MSGEWIKMRGNLGDDPAVIAIATALRINADEVVGKLHRLWWWADQNTASGEVAGVGAPWIDEHVRKRGFAAAMQKIGWLVITADGIKFPHFDRHNGQSAKNRALDQRYKDDQRKTGERETIPKSERQSGNCPVSNRTETGPPTGHKPDINRTRRREEEELRSKTLPTLEEGGAGGNPNSCSAASPQPPTDEKQTDKAKNGHHALGSRLSADWRLPDDWRDWAIAAYPDLDPQRVVRLSLEFRDYWSAVPGQRGRKTDWQATWRNNVRKKMGDA